MAKKSAHSKKGKSARSVTSNLSKRMAPKMPKQTMKLPSNYLVQGRTY